MITPPLKQWRLCVTLKLTAANIMALFPLLSISSSLIKPLHNNSLTSLLGPVEHNFKNCKHCLSFSPVFLKDVRVPLSNSIILKLSLSLKMKEKKLKLRVALYIYNSDNFWTLFKLFKPQISDLNIFVWLCPYIILLHSMRVFLKKIVC